MNNAINTSFHPSYKKVRPKHHPTLQRESQESQYDSVSENGVMFKKKYIFCHISIQLCRNDFEQFMHSPAAEFEDLRT